MHEGNVLDGNLRREGLDEDDLLEAVREHGFDKLSDIGEAMLELDGTISIIPTKTPVLRSKNRRTHVHR
jgi:uncharacterized membrane protein YcaP (DUF421 family)